jgi:hypothetical protein
MMSKRTLLVGIEVISDWNGGLSGAPPNGSPIPLTNQTSRRNGSVKLGKTMFYYSHINQS